MFLIRQTEAYNSLYYWPHGKLYFIFKISLRKQRELWWKTRIYSTFCSELNQLLNWNFFHKWKQQFQSSGPRSLVSVDICFQDDCSVSHSCYFSFLELDVIETWITGRTHVEGKIAWNLLGILQNKYHGDGHSNLEFLNNQRVCLKKLTNRNFN